MNRRHLFSFLGGLMQGGVVAKVVGHGDQTDAENHEWPFVECGARMHYGEDGSVTVNLGYFDAAHS